MEKGALPRYCFFFFILFFFSAVLGAAGRAALNTFTAMEPWSKIWIRINSSLGVESAWQGSTWRIWGGKEHSLLWEREICLGCLCRIGSLLLLQPFYHRFCPGAGAELPAQGEKPPKLVVTAPVGRGKAVPAASGGGREGERQESPLFPENTCQPKAGASMRCKNDRNVMLRLHNYKTVKNTAVDPHSAPSSLCTPCHKGFPSWGWRIRCKSHLWHPLNKLIYSV